MVRLAAIALAGATGALCRYGILNVVGPRSLPLSTLTVNVVGSFALGVLLAWASSRLAPVVLAAIAARAR